MSAQPQPKPYLTPEEYLTLERQAETKSEYWRGETYAMAGASRPHNLVAFNLATTLGAQLKRRPCEAYTSDMRVKAARAGLYTRHYNDLTFEQKDKAW
jgi:Uma2 family endonuclease